MLDMVHPGVYSIPGCPLCQLLEHYLDLSVSGINLNCILGKVDQLFKFNEKNRYFGMKDLPQELLV